MLNQVEKKGLFEKLLFKKFQEFYDLIGDADEEDENLRKDAIEVINYFNNPFLMEKYKTDVLADDRQLKEQLVGDIEEDQPNGTMDDYWKVQDIAKDTPLGLNSTVEQKMTEILDINTGREGTPAHVCPLIIRFQLYMLTKTDNNDRNVLFIACKHGLHIVTRFLVEKAQEF